MPKYWQRNNFEPFFYSHRFQKVDSRIDSNKLGMEKNSFFREKNSVLNIPLFFCFLCFLRFLCFLCFLLFPWLSGRLISLQCLRSFYRGAQIRHTIITGSQFVILWGRNVRKVGSSQSTTVYSRWKSIDFDDEIFSLTQ